MQPSFTLSEQGAFGSSYSWRLKDSEIRFRGSGDCEGLVLGRIPASDEQVASFLAALDLLQVWQWRNHYDPDDVDAAVDDGSVWSFSAELGGRSCRCGGANAYPSFADPSQTTLNRERFALLHTALYDCFAIEAYIYQAKLFAAREAKATGQQGTSNANTGNSPDQPK
jgi:hypothetical protein